MGAFMPDKIDLKPAPPVSKRMANGEIQVPQNLTPPADTVDEEGNLVPHEWETTMDNRALLAIFANPALRGLAYNQLAERLDVMPGAPLPWAGGETVNSATRATLRLYLGSTAGITSARMVDEALAALPTFRSFHPVRDYLNNLPALDGVRRLDTMLVDYLGAEDSAYTRAVTRKTFIAAIRRAYTPGCKHDTMLVLSGDQGLGKSELVRRVANGWFTDQLGISDMDDPKKAAELTLGSWFVEVPELVGMNKTETNAVKGFITTQVDRYRAAYAVDATDHPRGYVLVGTTNDDEYLRDVTGNRRFWPVTCSPTRQHSPFSLTEEHVALVWAEALHYHHEGEPTYLTDELAEVAVQRQGEARQVDEWEGVIGQWLDRPVQQGWDDTKESERDGFRRLPGATGRQDKVCGLEVWLECLEGRKDSYSPYRHGKRIASALQALGWVKPERSSRGAYGSQKYWHRPSTSQ